MQYESNLKSVRKHKVPNWFHDAKLGIFIHWGLYSVPAFAPIEYGSIGETIKKGGWKFHYKNNPYAEWYLNTLKIKDSPTQKYHIETYGEDFSYDDFVPIFNKAIEKWDPNKMADLFKKIGARYVVLGTKHHDGFLLWHSKYSNPNKKNYFAKRNIVEELTRAVKERGMRMGLYYSGAFDWTFNETPIQDLSSSFTNGPTKPEYAEYVNNHWRELIDLYEPSILWNDIGYPPETNVYELFAYFYNKIADGLINDRWTQTNKKMREMFKSKEFIDSITEISIRMFTDDSLDMPKPPHYDVRTPEYTTSKKISKDKFECCRGIGNSFGYNRMEGEKEYLPENELIRMFIDIVSKNGNLLLNVGPMADGSIPEMQVQRLLGLGRWLEINGEAIFGTRPWVRAEGETDNGINIRFTQKKDSLYVILLDTPKSKKITIKSLIIDQKASIHLLGYNSILSWKQKGEHLEITFTKKLEVGPAYTLRIKPKPIE
ncbi:MAG: alpha-L-fucosidase [Promethearchaeota archaeon]